MGKFQFKRPAIGSEIQVTTKYHWYSAATTKSGIVVENESWQDPATFSLRTDNPYFPVSMIHPHYILDLQYIDGRKAQKAKIIEPPEPENKSWKINSSDGKGFYIVSHNPHGWSCNCKGFMFRNTCRHINEAKKLSGVSVITPKKPAKKINSKRKLVYSKKKSKRRRE